MKSLESVGWFSGFSFEGGRLQYDCSFRPLVVAEKHSEVVIFEGVVRGEQLPFCTKSYAALSHENPVLFHREAVRGSFPAF